MKPKFKKVLGVVLVIAISAGSYMYYLWNMPHLDVQAQKAETTVSANQLANEFLENQKVAREKYLGEDGISTIVAVSGIVNNIDKDLNNRIVILLKDEASKAGVSCTFIDGFDTKSTDIQEGNQLTVKGIIRSGASFEPDMEIYENVVVEECDVVK